MQEEEKFKKILKEIFEKENILIGEDQDVVLPNGKIVRADFLVSIPQKVATKTLRNGKVIPVIREFTYAIKIWEDSTGYVRYQFIPLS